MTDNVSNVKIRLEKSSWICNLMANVICIVSTEMVQRNGNLFLWMAPTPTAQNLLE